MNAFERLVIDLGWVWNPTRSGSDYGIDGFVTPADDHGKILSFEIPIQVKGVGRLERRGSVGTANPVTREAVDIIRTHVLGGYFVIYEDETKEMYYCSANKVGAQFDKKGGRRKRLRISLNDTLDLLALRSLRDEAEATHGALAASLSERSVTQAAQRLYLSLSEVHSRLFDMVATIGMFDEGNLMRIYAGWADGIARSQGESSDQRIGEIIEESLSAVSETLSEYEVVPPVELLRNFPAPSAVLAAMQWIVIEIDEFVEALSGDSMEMVDGLGLAGLRSMVASALHRSFAAADGSKLALNPGPDPQVQWMQIMPGHYFLSAVQVALVVNRLAYELRPVLFPPANSEKLLQAPQVWIRHRSDEEGFVRAQDWLRHDA